jgi:hypothetical protein
LHFAAEYGHRAMVELLLASKAEVDATADYGHTPLRLATTNHHKEVAELLRQRGGHGIRRPSVSASTAEQTAPGVDAIVKNKQSIPARPSVARSADRSQPKDKATALAGSKANLIARFWKTLFGGGSKPTPVAPGTRRPDTVAPKVHPLSGGKAERLQPKGTANAAAGSKAELISMIEELTDTDRGGLIEETEAAKAIAASNRFGIDVVKELVIESFFDKMPMQVRKRNTVRSVSMKIGAAMGGPSFARWLAENVVVGRQPAQMMDNHLKYGSFGMWQDAKALCEKLGIRFGDKG